tara:strand:- start:3498 stop:3914 length:417 start_codon:yes stop_codon:yes gene_type:complete
MSNPIVKCTPTGQNFSIWCIPANFNYFVSSPLTPDTEEGIVNKTSTVKAHTRRQYAGDLITMNVSAHSRTFMYDPGRKVGSALPGFSFILDDGTEKRQFTLDGDVMDLHAYLLTALNNETKLYTQGARYIVTPTANEG